MKSGEGGGSCGLGSACTIVQSCNKSLGTLRLSDGIGMPQIYHFLCPPQLQLEVKNRNLKVLFLVIGFLP